MRYRSSRLFPVVWPEWQVQDTERITRKGLDSPLLGRYLFEMVSGITPCVKPNLSGVPSGLRGQEEPCIGPSYAPA